MNRETPPRLSSSSSHRSHGFDLGEDIDAIIGVTATAYAGEQVYEASKSKKHQTSHLIKAGLSGLVALGAFKMFRREHNEKHHPAKQTHRNQVSEVVRYRDDR